MVRCKRCGRILKNPKTVEVGYGNLCYKKMKKEGVRNSSLDEFDLWLNKD